MRNVSLLISLMVVLGACGHHLFPDRDEINVYPTNYKSDILGAMHTYLNNPTGIRDAAISEPTLKSTGVVEQPDNLPLLGPQTVNRYVACLRFTPKKNASEYGGAKEIAVVFMRGRPDRFVDLPKTECTGVTYAAFPELQKLTP